VTRPPLQQHRMAVGESPTLLLRSMAQAADAFQMHGLSFQATHTPIEVNGSSSRCLSDTRAVVSSETFGLIGDEPIKRADIAVRPEVNGRSP